MINVNDRAKDINYRIISNIASIFEKKSNYSDLSDILKELDSDFEQVGDLQVKVQLLRSKASLDAYRGDIASAFQILNEASLLASKLSFRSFEVAVLFDQSNLLRDIGEYIDAIEIDKKCLYLSKKYDLKEQEGISYGNMGLSLTILKDFDAAREAFLAGKSLATNNNLINIEGNYGNFLMQSGDFYEAQLCLEKLIDRLLVLESEFHFDQLRRAYLNLSATYLKTEKYDEAAAIAIKSSKIALDLNNPTAYANSITNVAIARFNNGDDDLAFEAASSTISYIQRLNIDLPQNINILNRILNRIE